MTVHQRREKKTERIKIPLWNGQQRFAMSLCIRGDLHVPYGQEWKAAVTMTNQSCENLRGTFVRRVFFSIH